MAQWLHHEFRATHHVTLTSHDCTLSPDRMRRRLKDWDARVNRALYGPKWLKHHDELIRYFAFLEKPYANPHWHLLIHFVGRLGAVPADEARRFSLVAEENWRCLMPAGTVNIQTIARTNNRTLADYVAKELRGEIQFANFITPDEFRPR